MKPREFDHLAKELFGKQLHPAGYSCERSKTCVFYRDVGNGVFHLIIPDRGSRGTWYDVKVFPFASIFDPLFKNRFPDDLGIPTDMYCYLSERGVGPDQTQFNCKSEDNFRHRFEATVGPLLTAVAIPYLDGFMSLEDLLPETRNPLYRAIAVHQVDGPDAALPLLTVQKERLMAQKSNDEDIVATLRLIDELISSPK